MFLSLDIQATTTQQQNSHHGVHTVLIKMLAMRGRYNYILIPVQLRPSIPPRPFADAGSIFNFRPDNQPNKVKRIDRVPVAQTEY